MQHTAPPKPKKTHYLSNKALLASVIESKAQGRMSNDLVLKLQQLTSKYAKKGNFAAYTYNDDMQAYAMMMLVTTWNAFDPERGQNAFAFFTQCIKRSFIQYLNKEKRQRDVRDAVLVMEGMSPSLNYQMQMEDEEDHYQQVQTAEKLNEELTDEDKSSN